MTRTRLNPSPMTAEDPGTEVRRGLDDAQGPSPIFLVGCERSGTTMLRLMLDHHPEVAFSPEFEYAVDFVPEEGWPDLDDYYDFLGQHRIFQDSGRRIVPGLDYPELVREFLRQFREGRGKPIVGATIHTHFDRLPRIWPEARYIHLMRDGRDVARSIIAMGWAGNLWTAAEKWLTAERLWDRLKAGIEPGRALEVRFEDLVAEPEPQLARICEFLSVSYRPEMLEFSEDSTYEPPDPKLTYQWKRKLSPSELRLAEAKLGALLTEGRGYQPSGQPPLEVSPASARRLRRHCRYARAKHRVKLLGPGLFLANYVSRRLGPKSWRDRVRVRINDVIRARLK